MSKKSIPTDLAVSKEVTDITSDVDPDEGIKVSDPVPDEPPEDVEPPSMIATYEVLKSFPHVGNPMRSHQKGSTCRLYSNPDTDELLKNKFIKPLEK